MILIIDDDKRLRDLLMRFLTEQKFEIMVTENAAQARALLKEHTFQALVVDVMMPEENGFAFVKSLLKRPPVLFLTACDGLESKIEGFQSGGDDYLTKPFEPLELAYRLRALIKRPQTHATIRLGDFIYASHEVIHSQTKEVLPLSSLDMMLLSLLIENPGEPVSRYDLASKNRVDERTIDAQINRLRKKLGDDPRSPHIIKTIRHVGYALVAAPDFLNEEGGLLLSENKNVPS